MIQTGHWFKIDFGQRLITCKYRRVCYHTSWSQNYSGLGRFVPQDIDPRLCTHLIYAYGKLQNNRILTLLDNDIENFKIFNDLKYGYPELKTLLAIGGWSAGSYEFTKTVESSSNRQVFISSTISFLREHNFDGLDLYWQYPSNKHRGGRPQDKQNFVLLVKKWVAEYWVSLGAPKQLLNIGLATFGRSFKLATSYTGIGASATGQPRKGEHTKQASILSYYEARWMISEGYGGCTVWSLDLDDFNQICPSSKRKYPLVTKMAEILLEAENRSLPTQSPRSATRTTAKPASVTKDKQHTGKPGYTHKPNYPGKKYIPTEKNMVIPTN
ncbi:hypothetical protein KUTeg_023470 [Tegillarca granosa]|uniref:GH18 domain-containing protein n=1 Tax=Tegillarca granosa TaxID=220873 RepID=A0ABQ9E7E5_TEGGR|nr:hypothetical protein KUTeg_023470 [Tegillarca granosa]